MKRYGLIGRPLGHSFSAGYFAAKFRREGITGCDYALYELPSIEALPELLGAQPELQGFNVTIPYKQRIFDYLDDVSEEATRIGAVNCVRRDGGRLTGFNTDIEGIRLSLLTAAHYLFDLVYNPERTQFLLRGERQGAHTLNGLPMLEAQAEASWRIWNGVI